MTEKDQEAQRGAVRVEGGSIFWCGSNDGPGTFQNLTDTLRLCDQFRRVPDTDWFHPTAQDYLRQLEDAIREASEYASLHEDEDEQ